MADEIRIKMIWDRVRQFIADAREQAKALDATREAARKMAEEARRGKSANEGWASSWKGLRNIVGGYWISQAAFQVASVVKSVAVAGLSATATLENVQAGFTKMLKSKSAAKDLIADLQGFADRTPFDDKQVDGWAQSLVGLGAKSKQVIPILTALGDAVAGVGGSPEDVSGALTAIEQIAAKGRLQGDEILQLSEHKVFAQDILKKKLGLNSAQFQKALEGGKLSSGLVIPMILKGLQEQYSGSLAVQSKTIGGLWSNIKAGFLRAITADPDSEFSNKLRGFLGRLADPVVMARIQGQIRDILAKVWNLAAAGKRFADKMIEIGKTPGAQRLLHDIRDFLAFIGTHIAPVGILYRWLMDDGHAGTVGKVLNGIAAFAENRAVQVFFGALGGYALAMGALAAATNAYAAAQERAQRSVLGSMFGKGGMAGKTGAAGGLAGFIGPLLGAATIVGGIGMLAYQFSGGFRKKWDAVSAVASKGWDGVVKAWTRRAFGEFLAACASMIGNVIGTLWSKFINDMVADTIKRLGGMFAGWGSTVVDWWKASDRGVEHELSLFWQHTSSGFRQMWDDIAGWASSTWDNIINGLIDRLNGLFSHSVFGVQVGPHFDHIGGGTPDQPGSGAGATAAVGGAGQALLAMPRGGQLYPPGGGGAPTAVAGGGGTSVIEVHLDGKQIQARVNRRNDDAMARR